MRYVLNILLYCRAIHSHSTHYFLPISVMPPISNQSTSKEASATKKGKGKRGPSSKFPPDVLDFLQSCQKRFTNTPSNVQANNFWPWLFKEFWERFMPTMLRGSSDIASTVLDNGSESNHDSANQVVSCVECNVLSLY